MTPVSLVGRVPVVLAVAAGSPLQTPAQWISAAKASKNTVSYATPGNGSTPHLAVALFEHTAGIDLLHAPYKGGAQAITDLIGGHVQAVAVNALEVLPHVRSGRLRALAVSSAQRLAALPDVPTVAESGYAGFEADQWYGVVAPAGTPADRVARLNAEIHRALAHPEVALQLVHEGAIALPGTPQDFSALIAREIPRWAAVVKTGNVRPE